MGDKTHKKKFKKNLQISGHLACHFSYGICLADIHFSPNSE